MDVIYGKWQLLQLGIPHHHGRWKLLWHIGWWYRRVTETLVSAPAKKNRPSRLATQL